MANLLTNIRAMRNLKAGYRKAFRIRFKNSITVVFVILDSCLRKNARKDDYIDRVDVGAFDARPRR
jgi:hypothetical protein